MGEKAALMIVYIRDAGHVDWHVHSLRQYLTHTLKLAKVIPDLARHDAQACK